MALNRGFTPAQFRDTFLGSVGPFTVAGTPASTATGVTNTFSLTVPAALGLQVNDIVTILPQGTALVAGVDLQGTVISATSIAVTTSNGSAGTYNPGASSFIVVGLRPKLA